MTSRHVMDGLPAFSEPLSSAVWPASAATAAAHAKPIAVARPIPRTAQSAQPLPSVIKTDRAATNHTRPTTSRDSVCQHINNSAPDDHAHHAAHSADVERAKTSRDSNHACVKPDATTCSHTSFAPSTGDIFRQIADCSFYFGRLSVSEASRKLVPCSVGTFLLRDSSDRRFLFALTVQTHRGPTSVRLARDELGRFRLDCDRSQKSSMPSFASVIDLVRFYYQPTTDRRCILVDGAGTDNSIPVNLTSCLTASGSPPRLSHLARLCVHRVRRTNLEQPSMQRSKRNQKCVDCFVDSLPSYVNEKTRTFLRRYPFDL